MRRLIALAVLVAATGCGGDEKAPKPQQQTRGPFAYDASRALAVSDRLLDEVEGVQVRDVEFASPGSGRVRAWLITPKATGRRPAVIFMHGAGGNRDELLPIAARWVREGGVAITLDAAPGRVASTPRAQLRAQRDATVQTVVRIRRAVDYLQTLERVDPERIGYVGFSAGARTGGIVVGVEPRIDAFVLMSGGAVPVQEYVDEAPPELKDAVRKTFADLDPLRWLRRAKPDTIFFQIGARDQIVPQRALRTFVAAAPKPQRVSLYRAGHTLNAKARIDQRAWLAERLGLR